MNRREFLKIAAGTVGAITLTSCSDNSNMPPLEVIVGKDVQAVSNDPADYLPSLYYMIPGGTQESISHAQSYYMKLTFNKYIDSDISLITTITSGDLLLMMITINQDKSKKMNTYHLDTNAYTEYLMRAGSQEMDIYFSLSDNKKTEYHAKLPRLSAIRDKSVILTLDERPQKVMGKYKLINKTFFRPGAIPAIARVQGNEKTIYLLHKKLK